MMFAFPVMPASLSASEPDCVCPSTYAAVLCRAAPPQIQCRSLVVSDQCCHPHRCSHCYAGFSPATQKCARFRPQKVHGFVLIVALSEAAHVALSGPLMWRVELMLLLVVLRCMRDNMQSSIRPSHPQSFHLSFRVSPLTQMLRISLISYPSPCTRKTLYHRLFRAGVLGILARIGLECVFQKITFVDGLWAHSVVFVLPEQALNYNGRL
jgi:hypothetical protein